jgi:tetratricopeptide (TPR) repeat protein
LTFIVGTMIRFRPRVAVRRVKQWRGLFAGRSPATAVIALSLVSATPPADWLRRGNVNLDRGRPEDALADFSRAAQTTTDPGLATFNEGVALFRLGRFREAELAFRRCLSDASGGRRVRTWYNLGCALLQESQGRQPGPLGSAVASFEAGLKEVRDDEPLAEDLRHNLELAKQRFDAVRGARPNEPTEPPDRPPDQPPAAPAGRDEGGEPTHGREGIAGMKGRDGRPLPKNDGRAPNLTDQQAPPGKGNLPPLPDEDALTPLTPEDAKAHVQKAAERIDTERRAALKRTAPAPATAFPDW